MLLISNKLDFGFPGSHSLAVCVFPPGSPFLRSTMPEESKTCTKCGGTKALDDFTVDRKKQDGLCIWCKSCIAERGAVYYAAHREEKILRVRLYYAKNSKRLARERREKYRLSPKPDSAIAKAGRARSSGLLVPESCEQCGSTENIDAHHDDYSKPLEVRWLCRSHHKRLHTELKRLEKQPNMLAWM